MKTIDAFSPSSYRDAGCLKFLVLLIGKYINITTVLSLMHLHVIYLGWCVLIRILTLLMDKACIPSDKQF